MGRALLFTGYPRVGKSTAVRAVVRAVGSGCFTGFFTAEDISEGKRTGFSITMIDGRKGALASVESTSPTRVKSVTQGEEVSYGVDLEFLEKVAVQEIRKNLSNSADLFIVIDEIGPMQLNSPLFRDLVLDLLESDKSILFGSVVQRSFDWTDDLKQRPGVETFLLTEQNRETLTKMMAKYLQCR